MKVVKIELVVIMMLLHVWSMHATTTTKGFLECGLCGDEKLLGEIEILICYIGWMQILPFVDEKLQFS